MGEHELQEALRGKAQERIREIWRAAEAAVAARRSELNAQAAAFREVAEQRAVVRAAAIRRQVLAEAALVVRRQRLAAEAVLAERLHALALELLPGLGRDDADLLWPRLAAELPVAAWQRLKVHPGDLQVAREAFPTAEVSGEASLGGGVVAATADGRVVVDNSLAGRLKRLWPELSARVLTAANEELDKDAAGPATTG